MKIYKEDIEGSENLSIDDEFDFSKLKVEDALVDKINTCHFTLDIQNLNEEEILFLIHIDSNIDYLDANTLEPLKLEVIVDEEVPFTFNKETADELDIDFFDEEIDLKELILELVLLNIPFNYSEKKNSNILTEEEFNQDNSNRPFAQIFNNKGEE